MPEAAAGVQSFFRILLNVPAQEIDHQPKALLTSRL
jgi:hypothetical protein